MEVEIARDWYDVAMFIASFGATLAAIAALIIAIRSKRDSRLSAKASDRSAKASERTAVAAREEAEQTRKLVEGVEEQLNIQREQHEHFVAEQAKRPELFADLALVQVLQGEGLILRARVANTGDKRADDVRVEFSAPGNTPYHAVVQPGIDMQPGPQLGRLEPGRELLSAESEMTQACVHGWRIPTLPPGQPEDWYVKLYVIEGVREVRLYAEHDEAGDAGARYRIEFDENGAATMSRVRA